MTQAIGTPRSYLSLEEREKLLCEGSMNLVYLSESQEAGRAGDEDAAWSWLACAELSAQSLMTLKNTAGVQFIREKRLNTVKADAAYGPGWLDRA